MDSALLHRLAAERLNKRAAKVKAEGWAWVETGTELPYHELSEFMRASKVQRPLNDQEHAEWESAQQEVNELERGREEMYESEESIDADKLEQIERRIADLNGRLIRLQQTCSTWTPEILSVAGAIVTVERNGELVVHRGLIRPKDRKAAARVVERPEPIRQSAVGVEPEPQVRGLSDALTRKLTAQQTVALQRVLADNCEVALAALAHNLVQRLFCEQRVISALGIQARGCSDELSRCDEAGIEQCRAWRELTQMREQWGERIPGEPDQLLPWLIALPIGELCDLLALCAALTVNAVKSSLAPHPADALAAAVGLNMSQWWEPTAESYLHQVPKALILEAVRESHSEEAAAPLEKLKKDELVARAEALLAGRGWLPAVLRSSHVAVTVAPNT